MEDYSLLTYSQNHRKGGAGVWWMLAVFGMALTWTVYSAFGATGNMQLHSVSRSVATGSQIASSGRAVLPIMQATKNAQVDAKPVATQLPPMELPQQPSNGFDGLLRLPAVAGGALMALGAFAFWALGRKPESRIAIAPFIGLIDKGGDPTDQGTDAVTERHRIEQRVVFSAERWRVHRSGNRFSRALLSIPQSYVIRHLVNPVIVISLFTAAVCAAQVQFGTEVFNLPTSLFSLSAPSLGLLLVFRTNASYERWDGARKMIGLVKNRTEDMVRQVCTRFPTDRVDLKDQMLRYIQAFPFSLKVHLRGGPGGFEDDSNLIEDLKPILRPNELELLLKATNRPAHVMQCMTQVAQAAKIDGAALFCLDQNLTTLADVLGGCERILRTPIPLSYTRMTTRFLFAWLLLLPFAMSQEIMKLDHSIWLTVPSVAFIAFGLLGIEEVGVQIEEPFSILPLEAYSEGIRKNTGSIYAQMNAVADLINGGK